MGPEAREGWDGLGLTHSGLHSLWARVLCVRSLHSPGSVADPGSPTETDEQEQEAEQAQEDVQLGLLWGEGKARRDQSA